MLPLHGEVVKAVAAQSPDAARKAVTALLDDTDETLRNMPQDTIKAP
jgi:DNA-binding FadR family transcriptional regulator